MSLTLFWLPGTCARVPFVALEEVGAPYHLRVMNRFAGDTNSSEYKAINPKKKVPALRIDDWVITENPVILRVLASKFPAAGLLPAGDERTEVLAHETMAWFASELHKAVARQRFPETVTTSQDEAHWEAIRQKARAELIDGFAILERRLQASDWLFGQWSIVDVYMLYLWWRAVGSGMDPAPFPRCADHGRRTEARPSVATVLDREETEFARFEREGTVPKNFAPYYVGRVPIDLTESS